MKHHLKSFSVRIGKPRLLGVLLLGAFLAATVTVSLVEPGKVDAQTVQSPRLGNANATLTCQYTPSFLALVGGQAGDVIYLQCDPNGNQYVRTAPASGATQLLATSVAASANQAFTSTTLGFPKQLTLCLSSSAATTFTVTASIDGTNFEQETLAGSTTSANYVPTGAGSQCEAITPASFVRVATSAANTVTAHIAATY